MKWREAGVSGNETGDNGGGGCCRDFRSEFSSENLGFDRETTHGTIVDWRATFGRNLFCGRDSALLTVAVRICFLFAMATIWVWSQLDWRAGHHAFGYWWIYLTHTTLTLQVIYHLLAVLIAFQSARDGSGGESIPCLAKVVWLLQAVCLPSTFFVFVLYWGLVFDGDLHLISCFTHGANFAVMLLDSLCSGFPVLLAHGLYFLLYAALFLGWSAVHYALGLSNEKGQPYIYSTLDWSYPGFVAKLAFIILAVAAPLVSVVCWAGMRWRSLASGLPGVERRWQLRQQDESVVLDEEEGEKEVELP